MALVEKGFMFILSSFAVTQLVRDCRKPKNLPQKSLIAMTLECCSRRQGGDLAENSIS